MTLLTHTGGPFEPAPLSSAKRELTGAANTHLATIKHICLLAGFFLLALSAVGGAHRAEDGDLLIALVLLTHCG